MKQYANYHKHDIISNIFVPDTHVKCESYLKRIRSYYHAKTYTEEKRLMKKEKQINYQRLNCLIIICIVILKLIIMGLFSSDYLELMFKPFTNSFLAGNSNPYDYYYRNDLIYSFPYPPMMLWILSIGIFINNYFNISSFFFSNIIVKLPLIIADLVMLFYLFRICGQKSKYILCIYFCSPVILKPL